MDMTIRPLRAEEQKYAYAQSQQIKMQTGTIGYLRGDFDSTGTGFYTTMMKSLFQRSFAEFITKPRFKSETAGWWTEPIV